MAGVQVPAAQRRLPRDSSLLLLHGAMESDPKSSFPPALVLVVLTVSIKLSFFIVIALWLLNSSSNLLLRCPDRNCPILWFRIHSPGFWGVTVAEEGCEKVVWAEETPWPCAGFLAASDTSKG